MSIVTSGTGTRAPAKYYALDGRNRRHPQSHIWVGLNAAYDMILGGHLHRAYIGNSLDFYPGLHRDRGIIMAQCGTTTSRRGRGREREKNSLNQIEIGKSSIAITHYIYFHESGVFEAVSRHSFRRGSVPAP